MRSANALTPTRASPKSRPGSCPRVGLRRREGSAHAGARPKSAELAPWLFPARHGELDSGLVPNARGPIGRSGAIQNVRYLDAKLDDVKEWKLKSSQRDCEKVGKPWDAAKKEEVLSAWFEWIVPFVEEHQQTLERSGACDEVLSLSLSLS